ncbi:MAG: fatty acid CoA ligase family protein [Verrucomicrobia bacterium]|nr:fatty acid CoA ligase family protein [Verrucomicrobiota bacterium]
MLQPAENSNIARHLALMAAAHPTRAALKIPRGRTAAGDIDYLSLTFAELDAEVSAWCARLTSAGLARGDRTLLMVRQGLPLIASAFALFRLGAVPVVIDPGMGLKSFLNCVARSRPTALVGIPLAQLLSHLFRPTFRSVKIRVRASGSLTARLTRAGSQPLAIGSQPAAAAATDLAAILFTSGSTGAPKGVCYEHGMFEAQVRLIRETYGIAPGEIDLPLLPIFALFNPALGMTTIVPEIDPRRPADVDPAKIVQAIVQEKVTSSFGSPTLWSKIGEHCRTQNLTLPSLRRVLSAGAPVPAALWKNSRGFLPSGELHSPYGATESLPVASVSASEIDLASTRGACVGRPIPGIDVRIVAVTDTPIARLTDTRELPRGEIGEIIVRGPVVTKTYDTLPEATALAKIPDGPSAVWHRMGDCGYLDEAGRLWFCGRKAERVETASGTLYTEPCEQVFRTHPRVARCALVGLGERGQQRPALIVEADITESDEARPFARELRALALEHPHTASIKLFYFHPKFPVDVRHNAKIHRLTLAQWALSAKGYESDPKR